jgi:hypothetical protein
MVSLQVRYGSKAGCQAAAYNNLFSVGLWAKPYNHHKKTNQELLVVKDQIARPRAWCHLSLLLSQGNLQ